MPDRLTDDKLRETLDYAAGLAGSEPNTNIYCALAELLTRRAESAPFAVGAEVSWAGSGGWRVTDRPAVGIRREADGHEASAFAADLTPVPTNPTAAEIFAEEFIEANVITVATTTAAKEAFAATLKRLAAGEASDFGGAE